MNRSFGETIRKLREKHKIPLRKLAAYLDIDQSTLSKIERNERKAVSEMVPKLAQFFKEDYKSLQVIFLSEKILRYIEKEDFPQEALKVAEEQLKYKK